jgi:hypothetical protein
MFSSRQMAAGGECGTAKMLFSGQNPTNSDNTHFRRGKRHAKKSEGGRRQSKTTSETGETNENTRNSPENFGDSTVFAPRDRMDQFPEASEISDMSTRLPNPNETRSVADLLGPWQDGDFESGLTQRCKLAWNKPRLELTNEELATLLRQDIATEFILPEARYRLENKIDDDSEMFEGELMEAVQSADRSVQK